MSRTSRHWGMVGEVPACPTCGETPTGAEVVIAEAPEFSMLGNAISFKGPDSVESYHLIPCGCPVNQISYKSDENGLVYWMFDEPWPKVKLTPRLRKIREALGL